MIYNEKNDTKLNILKIYEVYHNIYNNDKITVYNNHIYFNALINDETISSLIKFINLISKLLKSDSIYIHIYSCGGYLKSIESFIHYKKNLNIQLISIIVGKCYDCGFILAALCDFRIILNNVKVFLTKYDSNYANYWMAYKQCDNNTDDIYEFKNKLYNILSCLLESKLTTLKLDNYFMQNNCWDAKKYKKLGLVDEIVTK
jgi:ATP-dependent protease ClpP protease subunit